MLTPLHFAMMAGKRDAILLLLEMGADINRPICRVGSTMFHLATYHKSLGMCDWLLRNGADINAKDIGGRTPLYMYLLRGGDADGVMALIERGADRSTEKCQRDGSYPHYYRCTCGMHDIKESDTNSHEMAVTLVKGIMLYNKRTRLQHPNK